MKTVRLASMFIGFLGLLVMGCHRDGSPAPLEIFDFKFQVADSTPNGGYRVLRGSQPGCPNGGSVDIMRIDQITQVVQLPGTGYDSLLNCADEFFIHMPNARDDNFTNKLKVREGSTPDRKIIEVRANGPTVGGRTLQPSGMVILPGRELAVGERTTEGSAEISFGSNGPVFRCESAAGDDPWTNHLRNPATSTFFEFELTSLNDTFTRGSGDFKCIARNATDPSDTRLLVILEGTFAMVVH